MAWDDDKSTASDPDNPAADEQLTADEWDTHVTDQKGHSTRHEKGGSDEVTNFGDTTHDSVQTDELQNAKHIFGADSPTASDISTALSNFDHVVLHGSVTIDTDVDATANSTLTIAEDCTFAFSDTASATEDSLVYNDGNDDFYIRVMGTVDANETNVSSADFCTWDGTTTAISGGGGIVFPSADLIDIDHGWLFKSCDNISVPRFQIDDYSATGLLFNSCEYCHVGWAKGIGGDELVDCNGNNANLTFETLIGDGINEEIIDINTTRDTYIGLIQSVNNPCSGNIKVAGGGGGSISSTDDNITVGNIKGEYTGIGLLTSMDVSKKNFTVSDCDFTAEGDGMLIRANNAGNIDGLSISGRITVTADFKQGLDIDADRDGDGVSSENMRLDVEVLCTGSSGTTGVVINDYNDISGRIHAHGAPGRNIEITGTSADGHLVVNEYNSGAGWTTFTECDNFEIYGYIEDTLRFEGDNNVAGPNIDSISNNGSGNVQVDTSSV